jgi:hypothetical protein
MFRFQGLPGMVCTSIPNHSKQGRPERQGFPVLLPCIFSVIYPDDGAMIERIAFMFHPGGALKNSAWK